MNVLSGSLSVLFYTFLYRKDKWKIKSTKIPHAFLNILYLLPIVVNVILMANRIFIESKNGGGLKEISYALYIGMGAVSAICIYASIAMHYEQIIVLVNKIEKIVEYRKDFELLNDLKYFGFNYEFKLQ